MPWVWIGLAVLILAAPAGARPPASFDDFFPAAGAPKLLVILVETSDLPHQLEPEVIQRRLFGRADDGDLSMAEYYDDVSYGKLRLEGEVTAWLKLPRSMADYAQNSFGSRPAKYPLNLGGLAAEAVAAAEAAGVDLSPYDNDGDGQIDGLMIIYSGPLSVDARAANRIWPRSDYISLYGRDPLMVSGKLVDSFAICPEYIYAAEVNTVAVYCHELAHLMGLPDFSDKDQSSMGIGGTDLLGYPPPRREVLAMSAYSRVTLGWIDPLLVTSSRTVTLRPINRFAEAVKIPTSRPGEYFLLSYRLQEGVDQMLAGSGLLLWHVNEQGLFENNRECPGPCDDPPRLTLIQADGKNDLENNRKPFDGADFFAALPGSPAEVGADTGRADNPFQGATTLAFNGLPTGVRISAMKIEGGAATARIELGDRALPFRDQPHLKLIDAQWEEVEGDGDGFAEAGEEVNLVLTVVNLGTAAKGIYFTPFAPGLQWKRSRTKVKAIGPGETMEVRLGLSLKQPRELPRWLQALARGFTDVPDDKGGSPLRSLPTWFEPRIEVQINRPTVSVTFKPKLVLGAPELLVVDDAPHDLLPYLEPTLKGLGKTYQSWDVEERGLPSAAMTSAASAVVWLAGLNALDGGRYPGPERAGQFKNIVKSGHLLILSAALIKEPPPRPFLELFGLDSITNAAGERTMIRSVDSPIQAPGSFTVLWAYAPGLTPHLALAPLLPARPLYQDLRQHPAAVVRWTDLKTGETPSLQVRTLFLGFPLEALTPGAATALLKAALAPAPLAKPAHP